jgi:hypothetical protein
MGFEKISLLRIATDRRAPAWGFISPLNWTELGLKTLLAFAADSDE